MKAILWTAVWSACNWILITLAIHNYRAHASSIDLAWPIMGVIGTSINFFFHTKEVWQNKNK